MDTLARLLHVAPPMAWMIVKLLLVIAGVILLGRQL